MTTFLSNQRILIVTPEVTYLPQGMGNIANGMNAKAGGLADVSASLISTLFEQGADVHVALPVAHDTGGIHDTVTHLDMEKNTGNGFLFKNFDSIGLFWAIDQAMQFYNCSPEIKQTHTDRIMTQGATTFNHTVTARQYIDLYEKMLWRPFITKSEFLMNNSSRIRLVRNSG